MGMPEVRPALGEALAGLTGAWPVPRAVAAPSLRPLVAGRHRRRDFYLRRALALNDVVCLAAALALALALRGSARGHGFWTPLVYGLATLPAWVALLKMYGLYERDAKRVSHSTLDDLPALFHGLLLGCLLLWGWFAVIAPSKLVFATILLFGATALALVLAGRALTRASALRLIAPERVLLIGAGDASGALIKKLRTSARLRVQPIGMLACDQHEGRELGLPLLGHLDLVNLPRLLSEHRVGRVVVADVEVERERLLEVMRDCKSSAVKVSLLPAPFSALGPSIEVDDVQGVTVLGVNPPVLSRSSRVTKRGLDILGAGLAGMLVLPLLAVLAIAIRLESQGPVLFRQERIGKGGRRFRMLKLRTMVPDAEARRDELLAQSKDPGWLHLDYDPRITRVGHLLRLASLDELPQLWNVLKGEMSLVGPRPLIAAEDRMVDGWARGRLDLTPGLTGLWQVLGRTSIPFDEMVKLDYLYVTNWSLWGDVRLMLRTLPVVLKRSGAN
jgi:exopolysaccharide biosynthesis polyprenyl glycosylphosphotransferase